MRIVKKHLINIVLNNAYKLEVNYRFAREYIPFMIRQAKIDNESFQHCSKCGMPYNTSREYKCIDICAVCSGHLSSSDEIKHEKHKEYMRNRAKEKRDLR